MLTDKTLANLKRDYPSKSIMNKRNIHSTNDSTSQPLSGVLSDWVEAVYQLQHWNSILQDAIDEKTTIYCLTKPADSDKRNELIALIRLREKIVYGLTNLEKGIRTSKDEADLALEALELIEHTQTVLQWCLDIKQQLESERNE